MEENTLKIIKSIQESFQDLAKELSKNESNNISLQLLISIYGNNYAMGCNYGDIHQDNNTTNNYESVEQSHNTLK